MYVILLGKERKEHSCIYWNLGHNAIESVGKEVSNYYFSNINVLISH